MASYVDGSVGLPAHWQGYEHRSRPDAATAADAAEGIAAYALIRAWMADDANTGMLMIKERHVPPEAALFVMSLVESCLVGAVVG